LLGLGAITVRLVVGKIIVQPHLTGKIATVLQMVVVLWILLRWDFTFQAVYLKILIAGTGMFTGVSSLFYVWDGMRQLGSHPSSSPIKK
jgi:phosphatidylglycerophosphate synthase